MRRSAQQISPILMAFGLLFPVPARAADPEIDRLLQSPVARSRISPHDPSSRGKENLNREAPQ
jgi:hypothetical protein